MSRNPKTVEPPQKKYYTPKQAYIKAQTWCAYQERCQQEVRNKLYEYGLKGEEIENIIALLIADNFVNEERFAIAFAGGKFRIKKWGKIKIRNELKSRNLSEYCIKKGLAQIDHADYIQTLKKMLDQKAKTTIEKNHLRKKQKLLHYALSKGFEQEFVFDYLNSQS
ncbi:MAG: RecX family transcriptional regulator [Bacteroidetes bacterium]|nr:RecX family transcriptional regulator [Bacteroidota bacterium]